MTSNLSFQFKLDFSSDLLEKISRCIEENKIDTLWYGPFWESQQLQVLWVYTKNRIQIEAVFPQVFIQDLFQEHQVLLLVLDEKDLVYHNKIGNTLFKTSLTQERIIYRKRNQPMPQLFFKPLDTFKAQYLDKQALLIGYCQDFVKSKINGSNLAYLKLMEYNFEILEILLLGAKNTKDSFTNRLLILERIIPKMKTLFVKQKNQTYYILENLDDDDTWIYALDKIQQNLHKIVLDVLEQINQKTALITPKQTSKKKNTSSFKYKEKLLPLLETNLIEEIYQFHETLYLNGNKQIRHYYLIALTKKNNSNKFEQIIKEISMKEPEIYFTILTYTRSYIQNHTDLFSDFFKEVLKSKNRIFSSDYYPQIHWQKDDWTSRQDYSYLWNKNLEKTNKIIQTDLYHPSGETFISTHQLHKCLVVKLQLYIFHHLHYYPNTIHLDTLLQLALYAQDKEASTLRVIYHQLVPILWSYTTQNKRQKKNNLVLDQHAVQCLQRFFSTIEVQ